MFVIKNLDDTYVKDYINDTLNRNEAKEWDGLNHARFYRKKYCPQESVVLERVKMRIHIKLNVELEVKAKNNLIAERIDLLLEEIKKLQNVESVEFDD